MIKPTKLPFGVLKLFCIDNSVEITVPEYCDKRPDRIRLNNVASYTNELINNNVSLKSPITVDKGKKYTIVLSNIKQYFGVS